MSVPEWARPVAKWTAVVLLLGSGLFAMAVFTRVPSHERDWVPAQAQLPQVEIAGDRVFLENVRDFSYSAADDVAEARYLDGDFQAREIESLWYGISHFSGYGIAHTFLSFGFQDGRYLAVSIEARLESDETYHPLLGLIRQYELIYVIGTERDIVGLRSHWRDERVLLYELLVTPDEARDLFLSLMRDARQIDADPRFYNTLTDNCTTLLAEHAEALSGLRGGFDLRAIFPGRSDELLYELGLLDRSLGLEDLRAAARIDPSVTGVDDTAFSARIRGR